jgi:hypothetical protein
MTVMAMSHFSRHAKRAFVSIVAAYQDGLFVVHSNAHRLLGLLAEWLTLVRRFPPVESSRAICFRSIKERYRD